MGKREEATNFIESVKWRVRWERKKSGPIDGRLPAISFSFGSRFGSNLYIHINLEPKM